MSGYGGGFGWLLVAYCYAAWIVNNWYLFFGLGLILAVIAYWLSLVWLYYVAAICITPFLLALLFWLWISC